MSEKLLFELGSKGRKGSLIPDCDVPQIELNELIPGNYQRKIPARLPEVSEPEVVRHFINLSTMNHHVDKGFYPLGSCTMKYNPKINEDVASLDGLQALHPHQPESSVQGALKLYYELSNYLCEIAGFSGLTLQPAAGAHGELTALMMIKAYHESRGNPRKYVLMPDSAHGTNPASVAISGYSSITIKSNENGLVDLEALRNNLNEETAALMLTNPNTLGIFESQATEIAKMIHDAGALLYMDGANMNALLGQVRPGDLGFDVMHFNLHKTFSTPHGGGGPGSGPVAVNEKLAPFLPSPTVIKTKDGWSLKKDNPHSIGQVCTFYGNFGVMVKAFTYISMLGAKGLENVSRNAIINANYLLSLMKDDFDVPYNSRPMHEFVISGSRQKQFGAKTLDIAKRLLDFGFHAPTVYFPLIVNEALMIEPTETESKESLEEFAETMKTIAKEAEKDASILKNAPTKTPVTRLNEAFAAKTLNIRYPYKEEE